MFFLQLFSVIAILIYRGFVLSIMWGWFVSDTFLVRQINIPEAIGLLLIVSGVHYSVKRDTPKVGAKYLTHYTCFLTVLLGMSAIVKFSIGF